MKFSKTTLVNAGLATTIVVAGVATALILNPIGTSASSEATQLTGTVQQGTVSSSITASGQIAAVAEVSASFAVSGTIATVDVALGDTVTAGQQLGTLDTAELQEAVSDAQTTLNRAYTSLADARTSLATAQAGSTDTDPQTGTTTTSVSAQEVSQASSSVTNAQDQVSTAADALADAQADLASATLTAPISGLVIAVNGSVGSSSGSSSSSSGGAAASSTGATSSSGFVTIADTSAYTVTASIAEADIASVQPGQAATVTFPALDDATVAATVTRISPTATASNSVVTYSTVITLGEVPEGLRLGQTAEVSITITSSAEGALYVASAAITTDADGVSTVDVVADDGTTSTVTVELGVVGDQGTEIVSGLELGQTIVLGTVTEDETGDTGTMTGPGGSGGGFGGGDFSGGDFGGGTAPTGPGGGQ